MGIGAAGTAVFVDVGCGTGVVMVGFWATTAIRRAKERALMESRTRAKRAEPLAGKAVGVAVGVGVSVADGGKVKVSVGVGVKVAEGSGVLGEEAAGVAAGTGALGVGVEGQRSSLKIDEPLRETTRAHLELVKPSRPETV